MTEETMPVIGRQPGERVGLDDPVPLEADDGAGMSKQVEGKSPRSAAWLAGSSSSTVGESDARPIPSQNSKEAQQEVLNSSLGSSSSSSCEGVAEGGEKEGKAGGDVSPSSLPKGLRSMGGLLHEAGECRPCVFFAAKSCKNGAACEFCHEQHQQSNKRSKKLQGRHLEKLLSRARQRPKAAWAARLLERFGNFCSGLQIGGMGSVGMGMGVGGEGLEEIGSGDEGVGRESQRETPRELSSPPSPSPPSPSSKAMEVKRVDETDGDEGEKVEGSCGKEEREKGVEEKENRELEAWDSTLEEPSNSKPIPAHSAAVAAAAGSTAEVPVGTTALDAKEKEPGENAVRVRGSRRRRRNKRGKEMGGEVEGELAETGAVEEGADMGEANTEPAPVASSDSHAAVTLAGILSDRDPKPQANSTRGDDTVDVDGASVACNCPTQGPQNPPTTPASPRRNKRGGRARKERNRLYQGNHCRSHTWSGRYEFRQTPDPSTTDPSAFAAAAAAAVGLHPFPPHLAPHPLLPQGFPPLPPGALQIPLPLGPSPFPPMDFPPPPHLLHQHPPPMPPFPSMPAGPVPGGLPLPSLQPHPPRPLQHPHWPLHPMQLLHMHPLPMPQQPNTGAAPVACPPVAPHFHTHDGSAGHKRAWSAMTTTAAADDVTLVAAGSGAGTDGGGEPGLQSPFSTGKYSVSTGNPAVLAAAAAAEAAAFSSLPLGTPPPGACCPLCMAPACPSCHRPFGCGSSNALSPFSCGHGSMTPSATPPWGWIPVGSGFGMSGGGGEPSSSSSGSRGETGTAAAAAEGHSSAASQKEKEKGKDRGKGETGHGGKEKGETGTEEAKREDNTKDWPLLGSSSAGKRKGKKEEKKTQGTKQTARGS